MGKASDGAKNKTLKLSRYGRRRGVAFPASSSYGVWGDLSASRCLPGKAVVENTFVACLDLSERFWES